VQITIINQQKKIPISKRAVRAAALKILGILNPIRNTKTIRKKSKISNRVKANLPGELTIVYVDNKTIQKLNSRFLGESRPTDVLCFDLSGGGRLTADIVISTEAAWGNSRLYRTSPSEEVSRYLIHGILHLLGFDDRKKKDRMRMQRKVAQILRRI